MSKSEHVIIAYEFGVNSAKREAFDENDKHKERVEVFKALPFAEELIDVFRHYVNNFIPTPVELENKYWMCSCFPGGDYYTPIRINIYWHEVFRIHEGVASGEEETKWEVMVFTDKFILTPDEFRTVKKIIPETEIDGQLRYPKGLDEQQPLIVPVSKYFEFMDQHSIVESIKQYNYKLMQKGKRVHNGHNYSLASLALK